MVAKWLYCSCKTSKTQVLSLENNFASVLTECFSCHQGDSRVWTNTAIYCHALLHYWRSKVGEDSSSLPGFSSQRSTLGCLLLGKQSNVVYCIPCNCAQVYIREARWRLETRLKQHRDACNKGMMEKSAIVMHVWENHHPIYWEETTVLDHGRGQELLVKEALHIQMKSSEEYFNRDGGLEVPGCWSAVMRRQGGWSYPHWPLTSNDVYPQ